MNIFIHRRDLRNNDNYTMNYMSRKVGDITPIFIFTPEQIDRKKNEYFSNNLVQFMCETLVELDQNYREKNSRLNLFEGDIISVLDSIHKLEKINSLGFNADYSPYAKKRDDKIEAWCKKNKVKFFKKEDMLLVNIIGNKNYPNKKTLSKLFNNPLSLIVVLASVWYLTRDFIYFTYAILIFISIQVLLEKLALGKVSKVLFFSC